MDRVADSERFIGIDVASSHVDVCVRPTGEAKRFATDDGLEDLVAFIREQSPTLVVMEATGGYETPVAAAIATTGIAVAIVNPRQVRDFAKATGRLAKTDTLDAAAIAHFADAVRPEARAMPDEETRDLNELVVRRRQLIEMRYFKEWSYEEIASTLDLPLGTVKAQLFRARDLLYQILKDSQDKI